ncbi:portal protein [Arthrobacter phage Pureglobe5]|nr:portal protein [Arthrobacter phage Odyssey395]UYL87387.1 portal protein [Arthrobacter phage Pureglobe5]
MGRMPKKSASPTANALVASAASFRGTKLGTITRKSTSDSWQTEAYGFYHSCGEFRFGVDWVGSMLSKALLYGTKENPDGTVETVKETTVQEIISALFGNADGRTELLRLAGIHMTIAGEFYIATYPDPDKFGDGGDVWEIAPATKAKRSNEGVWTINDRALDRTNGINPEEVFVIRIWKPDPVEPQQATSPARAVLRTLRELAGLSDHVSAQIDSRLAGAGIFLLPDSLNFEAPPGAEGAEVTKANDAEQLTKKIAYAMQQSLLNRATAEAIVPIIITAPAEAISAAQHITFWSELDAHAIELRNEAIRRLALGLDMPPEVLTGSSDSNHWSAWQADESAIKSHTEPLLKIITTALARGYLRPLLSDEGGVADEDLRLYSIAADTSEMRLRPNRSKEAVEMYDRGELSGKAMLREVGFEESDAMDDEERKTWMLRQIAGGSPTPEMVAEALRVLQIMDVQIATEPEAQPGEAAEDPTPNSPSLEDHPQRNIPDQETGERRKASRDAGDVPSADRLRKAALIAASEQLAIRALERAGNRLKNKADVKFSTPAVALHTVIDAGAFASDLLIDAWAHLRPVAERYGVEPVWLEATLDEYCHQLFRTHRGHEFDAFETFMNHSLTEERTLAA